ncbi:TolB family protein [Citreicoccus inhibens]|uniref:TolB family protein n=1 Tax=Citreicoccus inhibens TaxID=2849499 RepID=UPI001F2942A9|nr:hypothetical protein [Citreicoccus inhibens]
MLRTLATLMGLLPALASAEGLVYQTLQGTTTVVNDGPGDQTDPHVSGGWVAYTSESRGTSEIRYHDLSSGMDEGIPNNGAFDFVSDISGSTVVFTRVNSASAIFTFDVASKGPPVELAPEVGSSRRAAVIGGSTVSWQDFGFTGSSVAPEIAAFDMQKGTLTRLTDDLLLDRDPSVSPDGAVVVWTKCDPRGTQCDIYQASSTQGGYLTTQVTGAEGEESQPDTNGKVIVYASTRTINGVSERDIYWKPVGGGIEQRLALPGPDSNPSISGDLIAFERQDPTAPTPNFDIVLYDMKTQTLYRLTDSDANESLTDLSVEADGTVHVVWAVPENGDSNVRAFSFKLPRDPECHPAPDAKATPEQVCQLSGSWPLLAAMEVARTTGQPNAVSLGFGGSGQGVLCVDNGFNGERATSGWVWISNNPVVDPSEFKQSVALVAKSVTLSGNNSLAALISGKAGSSFRLRAYGPPAEVCERPHLDATAPAGASTVMGTRVAAEPVPVVSATASAIPTPVFVREGPVRGAVAATGCSAGGGSLALSGVLLVLAALIRSRRIPCAATGRGG